MMLTATLPYFAALSRGAPQGFTVAGAHATTWRGRLFVYGFDYWTAGTWTRGPLEHWEDAGAFQRFLTELRAAGCTVTER